jgi:predicted MFS family arabinose efflux permease
MTPLERRATMALASVYAVRMLGLFMILPVFAVYAEELAGVTPFLVGLAIGVYGLTQAVFQIPLGTLSDRVGRKPVIVGGLLVFAAGSVLAALSDTIHGVIAGRALQGAGAIAAAVMALAADLTREEQRVKMMASIGMSIGLSFSLALVLGPVLEDWMGVQGIFWLTALLALAAIGIVLLAVPSPVHTHAARDTAVVAEALRRVAGNPELLRLDLGVFVLHLVLTANFVVVPVLLRDLGGLEVGRHWMVYLPVMGLSFFLMLPFLIVGEKRHKLKPVFVAAVGLLLVAELALAELAAGLWSLVLALFLFFTAFNLLEASLPSLVSKIAPPDAKGSAMGVYSTSQFLGAFVGGALGGALHGRFGAEGVFAGGALMIALWLAAAATMRRPPHLSSYIMRVGEVDPEEAEAVAARLESLPGVAEAVVIPEEGVAYLKVDRKRLDESRLRAYGAPA